MSFFSFFKPVAHQAAPILQATLAIAENQAKPIVTQLAAAAAEQGVDFLLHYLAQKLQSGESALTVAAKGTLTPADQDLVKLKMAVDTAKQQLPGVRDSVLYGAITTAILELKGNTPAILTPAPSEEAIAAARAPITAGVPGGGYFVPGAAPGEQQK